MRVSSFFRYQSTLQQMQKTNSSLDDITYQLTSGLKARSYSQISGDTNQLLNLKDVWANNETYMDNISAAQSRLVASENSLQNLSDLLVEASNVYTQARNELSPEVRATLGPKAEGLAESFYAILNTQFEGRYLFSGQDSGTPPTSASPTPNPFPGDPPPTAYYDGDTTRNIIIDGPGTRTSYGITGDDEAFARTKAGLETLWFGLENDSELDIDGAIDLLEQAQKDVADALGDVGGTLSGLDLIKERHESNNIFLKQRVDEIEKADVAEASTRFAQEEVVLNASLNVTSRLLQISLLNYLR